jgi:hypothetical protein
LLLLEDRNRGLSLNSRPGLPKADQLMETALARATTLAEISGEAYCTVNR